MRLAQVSDLRPGMQVARNVCDDRLELLVAAGMVLDMRMIRRLEELEVQDIYIHERGTEDIEPDEMISDKTRRKTHRLLKRTFDDLLNVADMAENADDDVSTLLQYDDRYANSVNVANFHEVIHSTIEDLFAYRVEVFETPVVKRYFDRSYEHALNTSLLSIMLGRAFGYSPDDLVSLGTAAMLHDVGKLLWPNLAKKSLRDMDPEEQKKIRRHPDAGATILARAARDSGKEQAAIRQHHERQDGRGYPAKLDGMNTEPVKWRARRPNEIFRFAEILSVANAFDNLINGDLMVEPMQPTQAMETLVRGTGSIYNRTVVSKALELINVYPTGAVVEIRVGNHIFPAGMRGVVRKSTGMHFSKPEILILWNKSGKRVSPAILDMNKHSAIEVDLV